MHPRQPALLVIALALATSAASAQVPGPAKSRANAAPSQDSLARQAKITPDSARAVALRRVPHGTIQSAELEHEHGALVYSYDIKVPGKPGVEEVQVDAATGRVVSLKHETAAAEEKEHQQERGETKGKAVKSAPPSGRADSTGPR
jgi:uncharacterized membrane protein YkoI